MVDRDHHNAGDIIILEGDRVTACRIAMPSRWDEKMVLPPESKGFSDKRGPLSHGRSLA